MVLVQKANETFMNHTLIIHKRMNNDPNDMQWIYNAKLRRPETLVFMRVSGPSYL